VKFKNVLKILFKENRFIVMIKINKENRKEEKTFQQMIYNRNNLKNKENINNKLLKLKKEQPIEKKEKS